MARSTAPPSALLTLLALAMLLPACASAADRVHEERRRNEATLAERAATLEAVPGDQFVLIEGGELVGASADLEELLAAYPGTGASHRFLFRPADHGDAQHSMAFLPEGGQVAGLGFAEALGLSVREGAGGAVTLVHDRREHRFPAGTRRTLALSIESLDGGPASRLQVAFDPDFDGPLLLRPDVAAEFGLERFEVPGRVEVRVALGRPFRARRALVRVRVDELDAEGLVLAVYETPQL